ncbi:MAG: ferritin-like domain-containing protein [Cytophagaceae bacterium]|jgi:hypothetical protein|nr:ferritin-like domain-containing protein [Cytophagaceae bacterium]
MKTFENWALHFKTNRPYIHWKENYVLTEKERRAITKAIQVFQKGESSEARSLLAKADNFSKQRNDKSYAEALHHFVKEENRHSEELGKWMDMHQIPRLKSHWEDSIFRILRKPGGLEVSVSVLLTAEIMASSFYHALLYGTRSGVLKQICTNILIDEEQHILFQSQGLAQFYSERSAWKRECIHVLRALLLLGATQLVWFSHRSVFKSGGYSYSRFMQESFQIFAKSMHQIEWMCERKKTRLSVLLTENNRTA